MRVSGNLGRPDTDFEGEVIERYTVELCGFDVPAVKVRCDDGSFRYMLQGDVTEVVDYLEVSPAGVVYTGQYDVLTVKTGGIRCGNCERRHPDIAHVRACHQLSVEMQAEMAAEQAVERAYERHLEDRGYDEARFQEQMELAHGIRSDYR